MLRRYEKIIARRLFSKKQDNWIQRVDPDFIIRTGTIIIAWIYLSGIITLSLYLSKYGISSFSILRFQYITAGAWCIFPIVYSSLYILYASLPIILLKNKYGTTGNGRMRIRHKILIVAYIIFAAYMAIYMYIGYIHIYIELPLITTILYFIQSVGSLLPFLIIFWLRKRVIARSKPLLIYYATITSIIFYFFYILFFAKEIYPLIPAKIGGGEPIDVQFIVTKDSHIAETIHGIDSLSHLTQPCKLIFTTDISYIILSPDDSVKSIKFDRNYIEGFWVIEDSVLKPGLSDQDNTLYKADTLL